MRALARGLAVHFDLVQHEHRAPLGAKTDEARGETAWLDDPRVEIAEGLGSLGDLAPRRPVVRNLERQWNRLLVDAVRAAVYLDPFDLVLAAEIDGEPGRIFVVAVKVVLPADTIDRPLWRGAVRFAARGGRLQKSNVRRRK